jgi:uncharacterized damage-inducible protein DinB
MREQSTDAENTPNSYKRYFVKLAEYSNWADSMVMDWLMQISDEQWNQVIISSFPSIRETAVHMVSAKKVWLDFWTNTSKPVYLSSTFSGSRTELLNIWKSLSKDLISFITNYAVEDYAKEIHLKKPNGTSSFLEFRKTFPHMINHATYHRGQLVTLLRQSGFSSLSNTDLFTFYTG